MGDTDASCRSNAGRFQVERLTNGEETILFNVGRCLLADRDMLLCRLTGLRTSLVHHVLRVLMLWHRAKGLKGMLRVLRSVGLSDDVSPVNVTDERTAAAHK